jgi:hypothetical protein
MCGWQFIEQFAEWLGLENEDGPMFWISLQIRELLSPPSLT